MCPNLRPLLQSTEATSRITRDHDAGSHRARGGVGGIQHFVSIYALRVCLARQAAGVRAHALLTSRPPSPAELHLVGQDRASAGPVRSAADAPSLAVHARTAHISRHHRPVPSVVATVRSRRGARPSWATSPTTVASAEPPPASGFAVLPRPRQRDGGRQNVMATAHRFGATCRPVGGRYPFYTTSSSAFHHRWVKT